MMKPNRFSLLTLVGFAGLACGPERDRGSSEWGASPSLQRAHEAFLERDYLEVTKAAEAAYRSEKLAGFEFDNLQGLLHEAYRECDGRLPSAWTLPPRVMELVVEQLLDRRLGRTEEYELRLTVLTPLAGDLLRAEMFASSGEMILDSKRDRYEVNATERGQLHWVIQTRQADAVAPGAYRIRLSLDSGESSEGWVVLPDLRSPGTRTVEPIDGDAENRPWLRFQPATAPEHAVFERAALVVSVGTWDEQRRPKWKTSWQMQTRELDVDAIQLGELPPGRNHVIASLGMERRFGPVSIRRLVRNQQVVVVR